MSRILIGSIDVLYVLTLIGLAVFGLNNLVSVALYWLKKDRPNARRVDTLPVDWPRVTVQLPLYNERYTIERLIRAVSCFDYPRDRLQVQVLDDSTDDTAELVRRLVARQEARGLDVELIQRRDRHGYKAGALAEGLKTATGELIAIFDADFVPGPDWLKQTVPEFQDARLGCLQTRWGHLNDQFNPLTRAQSLGIDGHFIVEQTARSRNGLFMNFNGTAGLWRKACIEDAGGWENDTLTEDLDLSYRAQIRGWSIDYLPDVVVPAELPVQVEALKRQQFRWAKGSFQTIKKLALRILKSDAPGYKRILGLIQIGGYIVHPFMLISLLLMLPVGYFTPQVFSWMPWTFFAGFGPPILYLVSASESHPHLSDRLRILPLLTVIGFGLSFNNTLAVLEGLFGKKHGTFMRTPKFNLTGQKGSWAGTAYAVPVSPSVWVELALGFYALMSGIILGVRLGWNALPWMLVFAVSYFYVAGLNLSQTSRMHRLRAGMAVS